MTIARVAAGRGDTGEGRRQMVVLALLPLAICLLSPALASAQTLFGPKTYTQTSAAPQTFGATFSVPASVPPPYYLHVENGKPDGSARVLSGSLLLNGTEAIAPRELGGEAVLLDKPVPLQGVNLLALTLSGPVGGTLTLKIEARAPALTTVIPGTGTQGTTLTVDVVAVNTHFLPGVTQATFGPGISVGGAPLGALGPVTVTDAAHFTATLTIAPTTILGPRAVIAKTNGEIASLFHGFTVLPSTPALAATTVSTLAGTGSPGLSDGAGPSAQFAFPADVAVNGAGILAVADTGNSKLRQVSPDGTVSTVTLPVALLLPGGVTVDSAGRTVIADTARCVIRIVNSDGTVTTIGKAGTCAFANGPAGTARFKFPRDVVADAAGNLYVADTGNFRVRRIDAQGNVATLAGSGAFGGADGPGPTATFGFLSGIALAPDGTVTVTDAVYHKLRQIAPDGTVSTLTGTGTAGFKDGDAASAQFFFPTGLHRDQAGNLDIADTGNHLIRRLTPEGQVVTLAGTGLKGSADGTGAAASFHFPLGLAGDASKLFVADTANHKIRLLVLQAAPIVTAITPTSAVHGSTVSPFTVTGTNLLGATRVDFLRGDGTPDPAITATDIAVTADGTTLTATVTIAGTAALGPRTVSVTTPGGTSDATLSPATTFTVLGQLTLIPAFQTLAVGATGSLTITLS
ncbi:MAG: hypothetical protein L0214_14150, partial [candidate division NC10 bacterium]|nr:hypothetical protein [candidate division NC10 bacterium]